jgi:hypothetical protein
VEGERLCTSIVRNHEKVARIKKASRHTTGQARHGGMKMCPGWWPGGHKKLATIRRWKGQLKESRCRVQNSIKRSPGAKAVKKTGTGGKDSAFEQRTQATIGKYTK